MKAGPASRSPEVEPIPPRAWAALAVASATVVLIILDSGFVSLAFPEIEAEFSTSARSTLSWVSSGYFIALASLMLVAGRLAERWGRKRVFLGGLALYAVGALLIIVAVSPAAVIAARLLQGAGAAALTPVSLAIALQEFPVSRRSTAIAGWAVIGGSSGVVAPTLGAIIVDAGGWRAPFVLLVLLLAVVAAVAARTLQPDDRPAVPSPVDLPSVPLAIFSVGAVALLLSKGPAWGWGDLRPYLAAVTALVAGPWLLVRSRTAAGSLVDLGLFSRRSFTIGSVCSAFTQLGFFSFFFTAPLFFNGVWGYSVLTAGFALALHQGVSALVGVPLGRLAESVGPRLVVGVGGLLAGSSFLWLVIAVDDSPNFVVAVLPAFLFGGVGTMANGAFSTSLALREIPDDTLARATSAYYVTRRLASGLGVVVGVMLLGDTEAAAPRSSFIWVWAFAGACYAISGLVAFADRPQPR